MCNKKCRRRVLSWGHKLHKLHCLYKILKGLGVHANRLVSADFCTVTEILGLVHLTTAPDEESQTTWSVKPTKANWMDQTLARTPVYRVNKHTSWWQSCTNLLFAYHQWNFKKKKRRRKKKWTNMEDSRLSLTLSLSLAVGNTWLQLSR